MLSFLDTERAIEESEMNETYPAARRRLISQMGALADEALGTMEAFGALHKVATADGALSRAHKELIALGIGIAVHCDGCIAHHVHDALAAGAAREEVVETIEVAILMGGGPSVVYGAQAYQALAEFLDS